ncbi:SDR family NAD(P)-dependent oxidoreductase [Streptomyces jumonjinensis]|uniref:SDR family NAD(P)-dependent oxidoreductase n=1 Tax=Streptomyces jumonjinensis TaxID=1945 RepID=UPI0037998D1D
MGTVVVTGSATGIGRAIALRLGAEHAVVVNAKDSVEDGRGTADEILASGGNAVFVQADVSTRQGAEELISRGCEALGPVTLLVNNAGATRAADLGDWDEEHWHDMLDTNLLSAALTTQAFASQLGGARGAVVNVASARGLPGRSRIGVAAYAAAKAGVISLTGALAGALAPQVSVNVVSPGFVNTRYFDRPDATDGERARIEAWRTTVPIQRFMEPEEIADAVAFLLGNRGMTGANILADGGWTLTTD